VTPRGGRAAQVAALLGLTVRAFHCRRARLVAEHGFPQPLPGLGTVWDLAAVERWIARQDPASATARAAEDLAGMEAELVRRAQASLAA